MANMELITSVTVGAGGASSVTLPATGTIPQTYTDLKIVASTRQSGSAEGNQLGIRFNGSSVAEYSRIVVYGDGATVSTAGGSSETFARIAFAESSTYTANTFNNIEIYIPNYASNNFKSFSTNAVSENNATSVYAQALYAGLWSNTSAITSITLSEYSGSGTNFVEGSTFYLYGISNVTSGSKATGGVVSSDGTYNYHAFYQTGIFTPTVAISNADILVIAGGGGGGGVGQTPGGGGGGAGGVRVFSSQSLTTTAYTCLVGAGGAGGAGNNAGVPASGGNSSFSGSGFSTISATGGGRGGQYSTVTAGASGGSGGGGTIGGAAGSGNAGGYSPVEGFAGGAGSTDQAGAGGGGAGAVGTSGSVALSVAGAGGIGVTSSLLNAIGAATLTGQPYQGNYYYGGGGGGGGGYYYIYFGGAGGIGGGVAGTGGSAGGFTLTPDPAMLSTGGGGGGAGADLDGGGGYPSTPGGRGGSGLIVIRYAI